MSFAPATRKCTSLLLKNAELTFICQRGIPRSSAVSAMYSMSRMA
jgi:hypothetical protein